MADDTRLPPPREDLSREALTVHPENKPFAGSQWQEAPKSTKLIRPPENANVLAGGTENTAGGKLPEVTAWKVITDIKLEDLKAIPTKPCARDGLLTGIGGGAAIGAARFIFRAPVFTACSWAVGSFCGISLFMYQWCQYKRTAERQGMMRAMEILEQKDGEKKAREARKEKVREERRAAKEREQEMQYAALRESGGAGGGRGDGDGGRPWWKVW